MYKGVIFDMDGVLIDSEQFYLIRRLDFFKEIRVKPGTQDINDFIGQSSDNIWKLLVPNNKSKREQIKEIYEKDYVPKNEIDYVKYSRHNLNILFKKLYVNNIKIGIASASAAHNIENMLNETKIKKYIDFYISGEDCSKNKPDPEIYELSAKRIQLDKNEIVVIEDSVHGIESAKKAGLNVIAIKPSGYNINQSQADYIVEDIHDILEYILK
ncbi:HAD family hydrolase [Helcococcus kunzii]|uniref:HAD hydrolase, family IA n=1 Tax=Helcococcus kunzii ATCC 51366 TaxID=883114 RepID=H3NQA9_9FIRM|nr:HAD family phosphatase [Helcococcus kunzii]EHR32589.1 HAD hydrolase, family IA [Helcococcus kunzii ATCC 51366]MCT1796411.1 HAD family phosphatase [Helcococcus kunzii]MCT1989852.1 HAD family phosphatase [Helcococcus kunzii]QUY65380.1 HAD family phosphatase [Helcococcus kunzii]QZO76037.1 HAD family phosphatase [Helcococcus kunzii]